MKIKTAVFNGVASIEMADIAKKNALNGQMYQELTQALESAVQNNEVRAILLHGQADFFSVGSELESLTQTNYTDEDLPLKAFMLALAQCDKPIVAAVNGMAIGAACAMLLHCDFVYAGDTANFGFSFSSLGLVPDFAASYLLPMKVGQLRANEMLLLAQPFGAQDALEAGLVNNILPQEDVLNYARSIAERFNKLPPMAVRSTKQLMKMHSRPQLESTMAAELGALATQVKGEEVKEVINAFLEKRWPDFSKV